MPTTATPRRTTPAASPMCLWLITRSFPALKKFLDRLHAVIGQRQRPVLRAWQLLVRIESEALVDRRRHLPGQHGPCLRLVTEFVRLTDHPAPLDWAAA